MTEWLLAALRVHSLDSNPSADRVGHYRQMKPPAPPQLANKAMADAGSSSTAARNRRNSLTARAASPTPPAANEASSSSPAADSDAKPLPPEGDTEKEISRDEYQELINAWATEGAKKLIQLSEWKPGVGTAEPIFEAPSLAGKGAGGANAAATAGRLEAEIRTAIGMGPPPGMSKRQWERVQAAAKKQLAALDDHPDVFKDQGQKEVRARLPSAHSAKALATLVVAPPRHRPALAGRFPAVLTACLSGVRSSRRGWNESSPPR